MLGVIQGLATRMPLSAPLDSRHQALPLVAVTGAWVLHRVVGVDLGHQRILARDMRAPGCYSPPPTATRHLEPQGPTEYDEDATTTS